MCASGTCVEVCPSSLAQCADGCHDLQGDWSNCGACGHACNTGEVCANGACEFNCGSGWSNCAGHCTDLQVDAMNCGACGAVCGGKCVVGTRQPDIVVNITKGANKPSSLPSVSSDGTFVGFASEATNLTPEKLAGGFLYDHAAAGIGLLSPSPYIGWSAPPAVISGNGKFAFFRTFKPLTAGDTNGVADIYRLDLITSELMMVTVLPGPVQQVYGCSYFSASADGRFVVFQSSDTYQLYVYDANSGTSRMVAADPKGTLPDGEVWDPGVSEDGNFISFRSRARNFAGLTGDQLHIYVQDREKRTTQLASQSTAGALGNNQSLSSSLSGDGRLIAFGSAATNLVPGDTNGSYDVFVRDLGAGTITRVSLASDGTEANGHSLNPGFSSDGRYVAFLSYANNLTAGDTNDRVDVYVHDLVTHHTKRASVDATGTYGSGTSCRPEFLECSSPMLSANGDVLVFDSTASDLVPGSAWGRSDVYWVAWKKLPEQ